MGMLTLNTINKKFTITKNMKNIFALSLSMVILIACEKKEDVYLKDYLIDNGISMEVHGTVGENELEELFHMPLFRDYFEESLISTYDYLSGDDRHQIHFRRFTSNMESHIEFYIGLNEDYQLTSVSCDYYLSIVKEPNKIIYIAEDVNYTDMLIDNFNYNQNNGNLTFSFSFNIVNETDQNYIVDGNTDVIVYKYIIY